MKYKTSVINDPLGQTHSHASSEHCFLLFCFSRFEKWGRTYGRTTCAKTIILTGRDFGLAEWINTFFTGYFVLPWYVNIYCGRFNHNTDTRIKFVLNLYKIRIKIYAYFLWKQTQLFTFHDISFEKNQNRIFLPTGI